MLTYTEDGLRECEYKIENAQITNADIFYDKNYNQLGIWLYIQGANFAFSLFGGTASGEDAIIEIMKIFGVKKYSELQGRYMRIAYKGYEASKAEICGDIIEDRWFDYRRFCEESKNE